MTPHEIARRLTPAQKRALLWLPGDGSAKTWPPLLDREDHKELRGLGLAIGAVDRSLGVMMRWATETGRKVRAIVAAEEQRDE